MFRHVLTALVAAFALNAFAAVDANQASQAELESVKGIGPRLSGKIVEARKAHAFKDWGDFVERVPGVGPGNATRLSGQGLTVAGKPYVAGTDAAAHTRVARADKGAKSERRSRKAAEATPQ